MAKPGENGGPDALIAFDDSVRHFDQDGRLHVALTPISKATVNGYYGAEIPSAEALGLDPKRLYQLLRDPDELALAAATSNNIPLMARHIRQTPEEPEQDKVVGSTGTDAAFDPPYLKNSLVVWVAGAIDGVLTNKKRQLSCSYHYVPVMEPGEYQGMRYDGRMTQIRFNHVALVPDGRAGPDVLVEDAMPPGMRNPQENTMKVSRKALLVRGALASYIKPKLAADAALPDLKAVLLGTTAANWAAAKPLIVTRLQEAVTGKLANDADLKDIHQVLAALDALTDDSEPDEMEIMDRRRAKDETPEEKAEREKRDQSAKDKAARDRAGRGYAKDEEPESEEEMRKRHERERDGAKDRRASDEGESEEDMSKRQDKEAKDAKAARDRRSAKDETAEEKEARERREREADDRRAKDNKEAMDAAIAGALTAERQRQHDLREAERVVRPFIGELVMAQDSAEAVYKLALDSLHVDVNGVHPSAYKAVLLAQPKPGSTPPRLAHDSAGAADFTKRFPAVAAVRRI